MKKVLICVCFICLFSVCGFTQTVNSECVITVEISNVVINGGKVYMAVFSNAEEFRKEEPGIAFELQDNRAVVSVEFSLPPGEYVISAFQDANNNKKMDYGLFGIPKELVGISNYNGKGFPTKSFDRQKVPVNNATGKITIGLYKF